MQIKLKKSTIDIPFVDDDGNVVLTLKFDKTDKSIDDVLSKMQSLKSDLESKQHDSRDAVKEVLRDAYNTLLGKDAFEKVYQISPSIETLAVYFVEICLGIKDEMMSEQNNAINNYKDRKSGLKHADIKPLA